MGKMNWYKQAIEIHNLSDRNLVNKRIKQMEVIVQELFAVKENAPISPAEAKKYIEQLASDKIFTSYPRIEEYFKTISFKILDNPQTATDIIEEIIALVMIEVEKLQNERTKFTTKKMPEDFKNLWQ